MYLGNTYLHTPLSSHKREFSLPPFLAFSMKATCMQLKYFREALSAASSTVLSNTCIVVGRPLTECSSSWG